MTEPPDLNAVQMLLSTAGSPLADLRPDLQRRMVAAMRPCEYGVGDYLMRQGEPGEFLLLIRRGRAAVRIRRDDEVMEVAELAPGDLAGEMSLVTREPRTADVVARTVVEAFQLTADDFRMLADRYPELRVLLTNIVAARLGGGADDALGGKLVAGYTISRCVGRGGMGVVYEATRGEDAGRVALKMMSHRLLYEPDALRRFNREADVLMSLRHDGVARLYDRFDAYATQFLVMEFCSGETLKSWYRGEPLDEALVRRIVGQLADALAYVHGQGFIHRDLKPSNVMVEAGGRLKLLDFGLAKPNPAGAGVSALVTGTGTAADLLVGTPRYMAPEQFMGSAPDHRADAYALAAMVYEALAGRPVVDGPDLLGLFQQKMAFVLPPASEIGRGISDEMHAFLSAGLASDPKQRAVRMDDLARWAGAVSR